MVRGVNGTVMDTPVMVRDSSRALEVPVAALDMVSVPAVALTEVMIVPNGMLGPAIACPTASPAAATPGVVTPVAVVNEVTVLLPPVTAPMMALGAAMAAL
jgi:hypothetical protein